MELAQLLLFIQKPLLNPMPNLESPEPELNYPLLIIAFLILILLGIVLYKFYKEYKEEKKKMINLDLSKKYKILIIYKIIIKVLIFISLITGIYGTSVFINLNSTYTIIVVCCTCLTIFQLLFFIYIIDFLFNLDKTKKDRG
jgi:hypothetical protein